ncbi:MULTISPECIES: SurA N-terminal domain-containing protein [Planococcus]|uniref:peptidylprolyl isomerase n=1 Tax=Planococcus faecalis TaxID=1598147 RepID=A0ABN4XG87_9BACL|nr:MULTISPECIES: SurA N-terminal domain-containing protein [Planococcus]AQU78792.1 peptidylprolyl isomerase [Planococcus faecalis]MDJ0332102.1 SurA N-terminal domain-containing protein [Planococcus sp. S3-L1]OHX53386.1 peptidylprolyl isomerase [Planococcus faecalis]
MIKKWFLTIVLGGSMVALAACGDDTAKETEGEETPQEEVATDQESAEQPEMPEPDLKDIPDVVAEVNGEKIDKKEFESTYTGQFQQMAMQAQMSGQEVDQTQLKEQVAESLVAQELLVQETKNQKLSATEEQINTALEELAQQNGLKSSDELLTALEEQGVSKEEVMTQVESQVKIDQLVASETGEIKLTDKELQTYYDEAKAQQEESGGEEIPAFEEVKPQIEEQMKAQKESEATQALIAKLREKAEVTINL